MEALFLLIRLPLFLIQVVAGSIVNTFLICINIPLYTSLSIIFPFLWILQIPFVFMRAAFKNRPEIFSIYIERSISDWADVFNALLETIQNAPSAIFLEPIEAAMPWLLHGDKEE